MAAESPRFKQLPTEIRLRIWRYTFPGPRIITTACREQDEPSPFDVRHPRLTPVVAMAVCYESRKVAKERYSVHLTHHKELEAKRLTADPWPVAKKIDVWVDLENDALCLTWNMAPLGNAIYEAKHIIVPAKPGATPILHLIHNELPKFTKAELLVWRETNLGLSNEDLQEDLIRLAKRMQFMERYRHWKVPAIVVAQSTDTGRAWRCIWEGPAPMEVDYSLSPILQLMRVSTEAASESSVSAT